LPKANAELWHRKLLANRQRDARNQATLESEGWRVLRFWEHEDAAAAASVVEEELGRWNLIIARSAAVAGRSIG
jgi:DNA mismatch endonuclease (patch repair protein)